MKPATPEAYRLFHEGAIALASAEQVGMRIDVAYLEEKINEVRGQINETIELLKQDPLWDKWRRTYGAEANVGSRHQLAKVLSKEAGIKLEKKTGKGKDAIDVEVLEGLDIPFAKKYITFQKLEKLHGTYLTGVMREVVAGRLHCFFNLNTARTYRSSSDRINFQNIPIRDPEIARIIRRAFIPDEGCHLVEVDFGSIEVRVAACYHHDPTMLRYIEEGYDMHRDMGAECYKIPKTSDWGSKPLKKVRQAAKGDFVFASFYGSYYAQTARALWDDIKRFGLTTEDGTPLNEHLEGHGITELGACAHGKSPRAGTYEAHIQKVEDRFWNRRFPVYAKWRRSWYRQYENRGWLRMLTGFVCAGCFTRNDVINYPVQGSAFHCLLWCLIQITKTLRKRKMKSRVCGQIHDSIVANVPADELQDFLEIVRHTMVVRLPKHYRWLITPVAVEAEACPLGATWYDKKPVEL